MAYCYDHNYPASVCPVCKNTEIVELENRIRLLEKALELICRATTVIKYNPMGVRDASYLSIEEQQILEELVMEIREGLAGAA